MSRKPHTGAEAATAPASKWGYLALIQAASIPPEGREGGRKEQHLQKQTKIYIV
jgi:hypothetical protein